MQWLSVCLSKTVVILLAPRVNWWPAPPYLRTRLINKGITELALRALVTGAVDRTGMLPCDQSHIGDLESTRQRVPTVVGFTRVVILYP